MRLLVFLLYKYKNNKVGIFSFPLKLLYRLYSYYICLVDLHPDVIVGSNLKVFHGIGLVVNPNVILGDNCILRHGVTIGNKINSDGTVTKSPKIGDNVEFGCGSVVIGDVHIENDCKIGANAVVTKSVPMGKVVVGINTILP